MQHDGRKGFVQSVVGMADDSGHKQDAMAWDACAGKISIQSAAGNGHLRMTVRRLSTLKTKALWRLDTTRSWNAYLMAQRGALGCR